MHFEHLGDLQRRLDAARHFLDDVLYVRCYPKRWWSDLSYEEQDAVVAAELLATEHPPEVYAVYGLEEHEPQLFFRVFAFGTFERWNARTRSWVAVSGSARDYLHRRTIMGDGTMRATDEQLAQLAVRATHQRRRRSTAG